MDQLQQLVRLEKLVLAYVRFRMLCLAFLVVLLIAVLDKATAEKIRDSLLCRGIASNKIAWHDISEKGTD